MRRLVLIPLSVLAALATAEPSPAAPRLIAAVPADGAVVPAGEAVLIWRFDRPMRRDGWSVTGDPRAMPGFVGHPSFSADGRTWRITLRDGLAFHDGAPVRAADCVASLKRFCAADEFGKLLALAVDRWSAPSDKVIEVSLSRPFPLMLDVLAKTDSRVPFMMPERIANTAASWLSIDGQAHTIETHCVGAPLCLAEFPPPSTVSPFGPTASPVNVIP